MYQSTNPIPEGSTPLTQGPASEYHKIGDYISTYELWRDTDILSIEGTYSEAHDVHLSLTGDINFDPQLRCCLISPLNPRIDATAVSLVQAVYHQYPF